MVRIAKYLVLLIVAQTPRSNKSGKGRTSRNTSRATPDAADAEQQRTIDTPPPLLNDSPLPEPPSSASSDPTDGAVLANVEGAC